MKKVSKHRMVMKKQVQQVFYERDILTFAENPFVVGLWCTFQTKVCVCTVYSFYALNCAVLYPLEDELGGGGGGGQICTIDQFK